MKQPVFTGEKDVILPRPVRVGAVILSLALIASSGRVTADNSIAIDHNEPVDRRVIAVPSCAGDQMGAARLAAKRNEAASMVRWFAGKKRVYEAELKQHLVEAAYNKTMLEKLKSISGSVPEKHILELEKRVAVDVFDTEQLEAYIEMAKADIDASKARLEFLTGECR